MTVQFNIPEGVEDSLREVWGSDLARAALEALAIEGYRTGKLSRFQVQQLLGFGDRWETEAWLGDRGVNVNYALDDLETDRATLTRTLGPAHR